jgi:membrane-associated phospholipid phosphatase
MTSLLLATLLLAAPADLGVSARDGVITASAAAAWGGLSLLAPQLAPDHCRWCDRDAQGRDALNGLDRLGTGAVWTDRRAAALSSDLLVGALPLGVFAAEWALAAPAGTRGQLGEDLLIVAEAGAIQGVLNAGVKYLVARERPSVHLGQREGPPSLDDDVSFYSGHTSTAFALVAAAAEVASLRGYPHAGWIWALGLPLAAGVGYLRIAAGKHYLSDVLVGAAVGTLVGAGIPLLLHPGAVPNAPALSTRPVLFTFGSAF